MERPDVRIERDTLGEKEVPADAYYGVQTARAMENFPVSGHRAHPALIAALGTIKRAAAEVNADLGLLDRELAEAISEAAQEVADHVWDDQFVVDVFQAGAGTSTHMNANEVIANRANELLGSTKGSYRPVHPNDHVNMAQSTNDVIPTAIRLAALGVLPELLRAVESLEEALRMKAEEFDGVLKAGRTHLQDAVPVRLGQEFGAYATAIAHDRERLVTAGESLRRIGIGGTATGTGLNTHPEYHARMVGRLSKLTGESLRSFGDLFAAMQSMADPLEASAATRTLAVTLTRIANDLRLMTSGPTTGLDEIRLPALQPGSSIMPGKVNPVMAEMLNMVAFHVIGSDLAVAFAAQAGQLELNVMMPLIAYELLYSQSYLARAVQLFADRAVRGIAANEAKCRSWMEGSLGLATALNPYIGYHAAAEVAKEALLTGKSVPEIVRERHLLPPEELEKVLSPAAMTEPNLPGGETGHDTA
ncbi:MAG TPA: aspartate ammonia-lyase [Armatimonadetes bacterium]|jgi:fumarate hydratase class II|nr:aspartate ammonia-lyase [Armatimonadota bacterium]